MLYRSSTRWFPQSSSVRRVIPVPFVSKSGKFSVNTLYLWRAYPEQVIMSVISTVYSRILAILTSRFERVGRSLRDACIKVATVYTINKDDYVIDRFLGISRKGIPIKSIRNFAHYCAIQLDDDKRFVYSQALRRADWLKFQVNRPGDKSSKYMCHSSHLRNLLDGKDEQRVNYVQMFSNLCRFFTSERAFCDEEDYHLRFPSGSDVSSLLSEPPFDYDGYSEDGY